MNAAIKKVLYPGWELYKFLVLRPHFAIKNSWTVWNHKNRPAQALQAKAPLELNSVQEKVLAGLRENGLYITHIDDLFPDSTWLTDLRTYTESLRATAVQDPVKTYWTNMWDSDNFTIDLDNPFIRLSLDPKVVAISNAYFGMYTRLQSISLSEAAPVPAGTPAIQSQNWHRDGGNKRYFKMFIYLNDIEAADGPFIFAKKSQPGGMYEDVFARPNKYSHADRRISHEGVASKIPEDQITACTGTAGSLVFADTVGLHKGGYSTRNPRLASITTFTSPYSLTKRDPSERFNYPEGFNDSIADLPAAVQFAIKKQ